MIVSENRFALFRIMLWERVVTGQQRIAIRYGPSAIRRLLLLASNRLGWTLARARIGMGALTTHRQSAAMTQAAVAAKIHQTLDVHAGLATQVAFHHVVAVDHFTDLQHFLIAELRHTAIQGNLDLVQDVGRVPLADAMDVLKRNQNAFVGRNIHAGNTGHGLLSCRRSSDRPFSSYFGQVSANANTTPFPLRIRGPASLITIRLGYGPY